MRLFQNDLCHDPFWMLVACKLVNLTTWTAAKPVLDVLREEFVTPEVIADSEPDDLKPFIKGLGLSNVRSIAIVRMARSWIKKTPVDAKDVYGLYGCGKYAADSWAIFIDGDTSVEPNDGKLQAYMDYMREQYGPTTRGGAEAPPPSGHLKDQAP